MLSSEGKCGHIVAFQKQTLQGKDSYQGIAFRRAAENAGNLRLQALRQRMKAAIY